MSLANVTDIFPNATVSNGDLTIPDGDITSYSPVSTSSPTGAEMIYGLLETMRSAVADAGYTNVSVVTNSKLVDNGTVLRREYTFVINLNFDETTFADLNVKDEPVVW